MKIEIYTRNIYGKELIYPKCEIAKSFSYIAKTKTLSIEVLKTICAMGYDVELVNATVEDLLNGYKR